MKRDNTFVTTVVGGKLEGLKITRIFMDLGFAMVSKSILCTNKNNLTNQITF